MKEIRVTNKSDKKDIMNVAFDFVESAKETDKYAPDNLKRVYLTEYKGHKCLIATDGKRLHLAGPDFLESLDLEGKNYEVLKMESEGKNRFYIEETAEEIVNRMKGLLKKIPNKAVCSMKVEAAGNKESEKFHHLIRFIEYFSSKSDGFRISYDFLKPFAGKSWRVFKERGDYNPIYFANESLFAMVMPRWEPEKPAIEERALETFFLNKEPLEAATI